MTATLYKSHGEHVKEFFPTEYDQSASADLPI